jgi:hypothetical protein
MKMDRIPADILGAATETAMLELQIGADVEDAMRKGLESALGLHERHVLAETAERAVQMSEELEEDGYRDDLFDDGPAALLWLAQVLHDMLPPDPGLYVPTVDDLVEVILFGTVADHDPQTGVWTVMTADFQPIEFDGKTSKGLQVRLLRRDEQ